MDRDTNKELNSFRGFTLIELLAVIVVLAIIILIAVNAVLPAMERARRSSFAIEANAAIDSASAYFLSEGLSDPDKGLPSTSTKPACVPIHDLIIGGYSELNDDEYSGRVMVKKGTGTYENIYFYEVWIQKGRQMMIVGAGATDDEGKKVDISADGSTPTKIVDITESHVEDYVSSFTAYESCPQGS